jgi:acetyl esterase
MGVAMTGLVERIPTRWLAAATSLILGLPTPILRAIAGKPIKIDGQQLALEAQTLMRLRNLVDHDLGKVSPSEARERLRKSSALVCGPTIQPVEVLDLRIDADHGGIPARMYTPEDAPDHSAVLIFFHGGGFVVGSMDSHDNLCRFLAKHAGLRVLSVDYRLAPEYPFPNGLGDATTAFRYAVVNAARLGIDPERIALGGDSAGASLAAVTAMLSARDDSTRPAFLLLFYPATDVTGHHLSKELFADGFLLTTAEITWFIDHYCPDQAQRTDERVSPLLADDLTGLPPTYLVTAGFDPLRDEGEAFGRRIAEAGVPIVIRRQADLFHGFANVLGAGRRCREAVFEAVGALRTGLALRGASAAQRGFVPNATEILTEQTPA